MEAGPVHKKKRYAALAVLASLFLLVVGLTPFLLSTGPVLRLMVGAIDSRLPGSLTVDSCLVGWQQGILCQQVVYTDNQRGIRLLIPRLTSTQGLLELALAPYNLGTVLADSPQLEIKAPAPSPGAAVKSTKPRRAPFAPFWNHLVAELEIRNGQAAVDLTEPSLAGGISSLSLSATFDKGIVSFTLTGYPLHDAGSARVTGTLNLPARRQGGLDTMIANARVAVNGLQLRDLLAAAGKNGDFPEGEGFLNTDLQIKAVGLEGLEASGRVELEELALHGGFLGKDTPVFEKVSLKFEGGSWMRTGWSVRQLELSGDTGDFAGSGQYSEGRLKLAGKGRVVLPVLFAQFPDLLRLRDTTLVESGTLDAALDLDFGGEGRRLDLKARADEFRGLAGDLEFAWPGPLSLLVNVEQAGKDLRVNALKVDSPFFRADGRGDLQTFVLDATADLAQAFAEIGQLFTLEWDGTGQLDLAMKGNMDSGEKQPLHLETDLQASGFSLIRADQLIVPMDDFSLLGSVDFPPAFLGKGEGNLNLKFALSSWLGETFLTMNGEKTEGRPFRGSFSTDTSIDLDSAAGLLRAMELLPANASIAGDMQIQALGIVSTQGLVIRELNGEIGDLTLVREGSSYAEPRVRLEILHSINEEIKIVTAHNLVIADSREEFFRTGAGSNVVNFADRSLFLHNLNLTSTTGTFKLAELLVPDWRTPLAGLETDIAGSIDLALLSGLLRGTGVLNGKSALTGSGEITLYAGKAGDGGQEMQGELRLADVTLVGREKKVPVSREVVMSTKLSRQSPEGDIVIRELLLQSEPLQLDGTGVVSRGDNRQVIDLQGTLTPQLEQVSTLLRDGFGIDLHMAGGQSETFLAQYPLGNGENNRAASLVTGLHADRLEYRGISVRALRMPFSLADHGVHLELTGQLDEGKLVLIVDSDFAGDSATVTIPANSQILRGVLVQKPLLDAFLSSLHPLFGVLAWPSGHLDLRLDSFAWPRVGEQDKAEFAAVADLRELSLESGEVLREVLALFQLDKEKLAIGDGELTCTGRQGRVTCSPLKVRLGEAEMIISGSTGLDGTLDYLLDVPVTGKLAGEENYRFLQGATIRVAVRGTVKSPEFDRGRTRTAIKELLQQAASKLREEKERKPAGAAGSEPASEQKG